MATIIKAGGGIAKSKYEQYGTDQYNAGRTQGQNDVKNSPNSYGVYSKSQYDNNYNNGVNVVTKETLEAFGFKNVPSGTYKLRSTLLGNSYSKGSDTIPLVCTSETVNHENTGASWSALDTSSRKSGTFVSSSSYAWRQKADQAIYVRGSGTAKHGFIPALYGLDLTETQNSWTGTDVEVWLQKV